SAPQTPMDVGAVLKQARLRRGQSFEVVFQHTRIPKKFLEALESNRFDEFPAAVYLQGFLKGYCEHLDLEFEPLWSQIRPSQPRAPRPPEPAPVRAPAPVRPPEAPRTPAPAAPAPASWGQPGAPAWAGPATLAAAAAVALAVLFWAMPRTPRKAT